MRFSPSGEQSLDADRRVGLAHLRGAEGVLGDVRAALHERVDAFVDGGDGDDLHVAPREAGRGEVTEHVVPDGDVRRVLAGHPLALDVLDGLDGRVLADEKADHVRPAAQHQARRRGVRERVAAAHLEARAAVREAHVDRVVHAELELAAREQRQERARAGVGLHRHLDLAGVGDDLGDAGRHRVEGGAGRVRADAHRLLRPRHGRDGQDERDGGRRAHEAMDHLEGPPRAGAAGRVRAMIARNRKTPGTA
jgi:hypothetical protein